MAAAPTVAFAYGEKDTTDVLEAEWFSASTSYDVADVSVTSDDKLEVIEALRHKRVKTMVLRCGPGGGAWWWRAVDAIGTMSTTSLCVKSAPDFSLSAEQLMYLLARVPTLRHLALSGVVIGNAIEKYFFDNIERLELNSPDTDPNVLASVVNAFPFLTGLSVTDVTATRVLAACQGARDGLQTLQLSFRGPARTQIADGVRALLKAVPTMVMFVCKFAAIEGSDLLDIVQYVAEHSSVRHVHLYADDVRSPDTKLAPRGLFSPDSAIRTFCFTAHENCSVSVGDVLLRSVVRMKNLQALTWNVTGTCVYSIWEEVGELACAPVLKQLDVSQPNANSAIIPHVVKLATRCPGLRALKLTGRMTRGLEGVVLEAPIANLVVNGEGGERLLPALAHPAALNTLYLSSVPADDHRLQQFLSRATSLQTLTLICERGTEINLSAIPSLCHLNISVKNSGADLRPVVDAIFALPNLHTCHLVAPRGVTMDVPTVAVLLAGLRSTSVGYFYSNAYDSTVAELVRALCSKTACAIAE